MIPGKEELMYSALEYLCDGATRTNEQICKWLWEHHSIADSYGKLLITSADDNKSVNKTIEFIITRYLHGYGLTEKIKRGHYKITDRGRFVYNHSVDKRVSMSHLSKYEFKNGSQSYDAIKKKIEKYNQDISDELSDILDSKDINSLTVIVVDVIKNIFYTKQDINCSYVKKWNDEFIKIVTSDNEVFLVIMKRNGLFNRSDVVKFDGSLEEFNASKGFMFSFDGFTEDAVAIKERKQGRVILIDSNVLIPLIMKCGIGGTIEKIDLYQIDPNYFGLEE